MSLLVHAKELRQSRGLSKVEPCSIVLVQAEIAAKEEKGGNNGPYARGLDIVVALANTDGLLNQGLTHVQLGSW